MPTICERFPEARFIISGEGPKRSVLEDTVKRHGLESRVEIMG
jgi:phosphatidylinositol glycan class A protein